MKMQELTNQLYNRRIKFRASILLLFFSHGLIFSSWASRIPILKEKLGISEGELGTLLLMIPVGQLATMAIVGKLVSKIGSKKVLPYSLFLYACALLLIGFSQNIWQLGITLIFFGIFSNTCNIAINTQGVMVEKLYNKSIMTSFHGGWSLAGFVGALIGWLTLSLKVSTWVHFSFTFSLVMLFIILSKRNLMNDETNTSIENKQTKFKMDKSLILLGIIGFCSMAMEGAMFDWSGVYFKEIVQAPESLLILGYTSFMIMMAIGRFIGDYFIRKIGSKQTLIVSGILMFVGMMISVSFPTIFLCSIAFMLIGIGVACNVPIVYSIAGKHKTITSGIAITMVSSISFLGFLIAPPLIGYIAEASSLRYSFGVFSIFGILMIILSMRIKKVDE